MTIRLTVERERWWHHVTDIAADVPGLVPVVKGNGYGFGRVQLAHLAVKLTPLVAVGTIYELDGLPAEAVPVVLTPSLRPPPTIAPILTVGSSAHIAALAGWAGRVIVKLESSMGRYGGDLSLVAEAQNAGLKTVGVSIHPPLDGTEDDHRADVERWLPDIDPSLDVWVSHLSPDTFLALPATHRYHLRSGTYLWLGDRSAIHLEADVIQQRGVRAGQRLGYRLTPAPSDGTVAMVGAGTAGGVTALDDGRSPFHYQRRRLDLVEAPHMHTSMVFIPEGEPTPEVGGWVDLQRPLTMTIVDEVNWI